MNQKDKQNLLKQLIQKMQRMAIPVLFKALIKVDQQRRMVIIHNLPAVKFSQLIKYEMEYAKKYESQLWGRSESIKKELLDVLSPLQLLYVCGDASSWGRWENFHYHPPKNHQRSASLSEYFYFASAERISEIMKFLIKTTTNVKIAKNEGDIFDCREGKEFPFEVIRMVSCVHPMKFFPALNLLTMAEFERLVWLCQGMLNSDTEALECVFADRYYQPRQGGLYIGEHIIEILAKHAHLLENRRLYRLLVEFTSDTQVAIVQSLGKPRLLQMKKENNFSKSISTGGIKLFVDKDPNEKVLEDIKKGHRKINRLQPLKVAELAGEILLTK